MQSYIKEGIGRFYSTPKGDYPSVTTVLKVYHGDDIWLQEWREKVGVENADRIVKESVDIGSHLHYLFESFLKGDDTKTPETPEEKKAEKMFRMTKSKLMKIVDQVISIETPVWSDTFRIAGRFDLLCKTKEGKIALLDYKNTRSAKTKEKITSYRQQLAFYAIMIKETLGIEVEEHKVFMVNREGFVQVFNFLKDETPKSELISIRKKFWEKYGC